MPKAPEKIHNCTYCDFQTQSERGLKVHMGKKHPDKKGKGGRPAIIDDETLQELKRAFSFGATDKQACQHVEIGTSTLYNYQNENPEFVEEKERLKSRPGFIARVNITNVMQEKKRQHTKTVVKEDGTKEKIYEETGQPTERAADLSWQYLKKKHPEEFTEKPDVAIQNNVVEINDERQNKIKDAVRNWADS